MNNVISADQKEFFSQEGYIIVRNAISEDTIKKALKAYERMRNKCDKYQYLYFRKYRDIALNDVYGIEHIFHPDIFEEDIFSSLMESKVLELSGHLLGDDEVFLSRNRIHCTRNISHSGSWHRDGAPSGKADDIDDLLKKSEEDLMWVQATLPYYAENGFYIIPGSHKFSKNFIPSREILGTKKILKNEVRLKIGPGDLVLFNPFLIHRGTCVGRLLNQRAHVHMRFARKKYAKYADRYRKDKDIFKSLKVYNFANQSWQKSFNLTLDDPTNWYGDEIVQKKPNKLHPKFPLKILLILFNRFLYNLSRFYPFSQRSLENISFIKYPYLREIK